ncbi:hypothetical protein FK545_20470 (plasmid) [Planococcus glaciei]|nr:hypothetical protein [Planococcus glaciei]QDY46967.1 hypothetical protein FK545_20470 [Planococcus glaciei]
MQKSVCCEKTEALPLEMKADLLKHFAKEAAFQKEPSFKVCLHAALKEQEKTPCFFCKLSKSAKRLILSALDYRPATNRTFSERPGKYGITG